jgi:hypothetical protein
MPAGKYSLLIEQGATLNLELAYKDSANAAVDLTSYSGKMQIKSDYADNTPTTYLTLSSSLQPDGTGNTIALTNNDDIFVGGGFTAYEDGNSNPIQFSRCLAKMYNKSRYYLDTWDYHSTIKNGILSKQPVEIRLYN